MRKEMIKKGRGWLALLLCGILLLPCAGGRLPAAAEATLEEADTQPEGEQAGSADAPGDAAAEEDGVLELQALMEASGVENTEGMDLEELTEALENAAMSEYFSSDTGLRFQYPASLQFADDSAQVARNADGSLRMIVESVAGDQDLTLEMIRQAMLFSLPGAEEKEYQENGCLRFDGKTESGEYRTELFVKTDSWLHHITFEGSAEVWANLEPSLEYMIYSITTDETEVG